VGGAAAHALPFVPATGERSLALQDQDAAVQEIARQHRRRRRQRGNKENSNSSSRKASSKSNNNSKNDHQETNNNTPQQQPTPLERPHFAYILTRPTTLLKEGPSTRTVAASRSVRVFLLICLFTCFLVSCIQYCSLTRLLNYCSFQPILHYNHNSNPVHFPLRTWIWQNFRSMHC